MPTNTWVPFLEILVYLAWGRTLSIAKSSQVIPLGSLEQALQSQREAVGIPTLKPACKALWGKSLNLSVPWFSY